MYTILDVIFDAMDPAVESFSKGMGLNTDVSKLFMMLYAHFFTAYLLRLISNPKARLWFNLIMGTMSYFFLYRHAIWPLYIFQFCLHLLIRNLKNRCSVILMVLMFTFLSGYHIYRMIVAYGLYVQDFT